jgi:uncharacterized protein YciI
MTLRSCAALALILAASIPATGNEMPIIPPMATYQFGLLRKGPAWTAKRTPATDSIQAGHMANIKRMWEEGVLVAAGPMLDGGDLRGIFIFRVDSAAQVRPLAARDPAIQAGRLVLDLHTWNAPPGIGEPYRILAKQPGHRDSMVTLQMGLLRRGPKATATTTPALERLRIAHVRAVLDGLASGELATAGPFSESGDLQGVLVYRGDSTVARRRALEDPAVRAGELKVEMHRWLSAYGNLPGDTLAPAR